MRESEWLAEGYETWEGYDPFEDMCGPMYYRQEADGTCRCRMRSTEKSRNSSGAIHGGALMTFADYAIFMFAKKALTGVNAVTVSMNCDFTAAGEPGDVLEATGSVVHETRGMIFVQGIIFTGERTLLNCSAVLKKVRPRAATDGASGVSAFGPE